MKYPSLKLFALVSACVLLNSCTGLGGTLQKAGAATVFDMQVDSDLDWSRMKAPRQELWTIDGPELNSLGILSGIKSGDHVFLLGHERKSRPDGPWFRSGMRPDEIRDIVIDALRQLDWSQVSAEHLRPQRFGNVDGLRFDVVMTSPRGLLYAGTVAATERNGKLTLLLWKAPREYYFGRDVAAVNRMLDGIRFVR